MLLPGSSKGSYELWRHDDNFRSLGDAKTTDQIFPTLILVDEFNWH